MESDNKFENDTGGMSVDEISQILTERQQTQRRLKKTR